MNPQLISHIERTNLILGAAVTAVAGLIWGVPGMLAAGVGAVLGAANFWALHRVGAGVVRRVMTGEGAGKAGLLVMLLTAKMGLLFACVWVAVFQLDLSPVPFTLGISVFVVSIFVASLSPAPLLAAEEASKTHG